MIIIAIKINDNDDHNNDYQNYQNSDLVIID